MGEFYTPIENKKPVQKSLNLTLNVGESSNRKLFHCNSVFDQVVGQLRIKDFFKLKQSYDMRLFKLKLKEFIFTGFTYNVWK